MKETEHQELKKSFPSSQKDLFAVKYLLTLKSSFKQESLTQGLRSLFRASKPERLLARF